MYMLEARSACLEERRNGFHSTQNEYAQTCSFKGNLWAESAPVHNTASGYRKKKVRILTQYKMSMHKHVHSKVTYGLRVYQFTTASKCRKNGFHSTQNEYVQTCSFKGNLPAKSVPVHNTASG